MKYIHKRLVWLDTYLVPRPHKLIVLGMLTLLFWLGDKSFTNLVVSLSFATLTLWAYISSRKYGGLDTIMFVGILPFLLIGAALSKIAKPSEDTMDTRRKEFSDRASHSLSEAINEVYAGKIIETHIEDGQIYITVETPYGLQIPADEIIPSLAKNLHISPSHIVHDTLSDTRSYYMFRPAATDEHETYRKKSMPIETFSEIKSRILCQIDYRFIQI